MENGACSSAYLEDATDFTCICQNSFLRTVYSLFSLFLHSAISAPFIQLLNNQTIPIIAQKTLKLLWWKRFCNSICSHEPGRKKFEQEYTSLNDFLNPVKFRINVLCTLVKFRVFSERNSNLIIGPDNC